MLLQFVINPFSPKTLRLYSQTLINFMVEGASSPQIEYI
ncbi:unnamed protein product [Paramecium octaurelia]|uniref:Uncharacterized protein n=1 Tax=Paramecium octaurelia TaxID=43137 RepID=A0A8S1TSS1_PAROT|nr:unnamed protein product [Paramecium octaurelia]